MRGMIKYRIPLVAIVVIALSAFPAGAFAQSNAGLDAYTENPPGTTDGGSTGGGSTGTDPLGTSTGTGTGSATGTGTAAGVDGSGASAGVGLTEAEAAAAGSTPAGQLPATGLDKTAAMAVVGLLLLASGVGLTRLARQRPA
jgi:LPXTG-motif cell wall-anchored protein